MGVNVTDMCGIFGYVGYRNIAETCLAGLKRLEYRGYDSAGIAGSGCEGIDTIKVVGNVEQLEHALRHQQKHWSAAISHTRWATHGLVNTINAHPHVDHKQRIALVHNGIIENHAQLRALLAEHRIVAQGTTDSAVLAELIGLYDDGDILCTLSRVIPMLEGAYAFALLHLDQPECIYGVAHQAPLALGEGLGECFIASDAHAFGAHTQQVLFLQNREIGVIRPQGVELYDAALRPLSRAPHLLRSLQESISKGGMPHYFLKEVHEQPHALRECLHDRKNEYEAQLVDDRIRSADSLLVLGCGSSYHAGCLAAIWAEQLLRVPARAEIASEFRYRNPVIKSDALVVAISQSGETADTLAAARLVQQLDGRVIGLCNVEASSLYREADSASLLRAGVEVSVASSKAHVCQLAWLFSWILHLAEARSAAPQQELLQQRQALDRLATDVNTCLDLVPQIRALANQYARCSRFFFLGRRYGVPAAMEAALKLKELAYVEAVGYPAGELKHGSIALIDANTPTIALCSNDDTLPKMLSNISEVRARGGPVIAVVDQELVERVAAEADVTIAIPHTSSMLEPVLHVVVAQIFAYFSALARGCEIDQPRNLAKSVTVE